jgi:hypothetical protein
MESWKPIKGYEGFYLISNKGNVLALEKTVTCERYGKNYTQTYPQKTLKLTTSNYGYAVVSLFNRVSPKAKQHLVHRLVAQAFVSNDQESKNQVNHKDGNKLNNHAENLEWVTTQENTAHSWAIGLNDKKIGVNNPRAKLSIEQVSSIRLEYALQKTSIRHLSRKYSVDPNVIAKIVKNKGYRDQGN